jgi:hypothetical protein
MQLVKVRSCPCAHDKGIWGQQTYSTTHSSPQMYMDIRGQVYALTALPQGKGPLLPIELDYELASEWVWIFCT